MKRLTLFVTAAFIAVGIALWASQSYLVRWEPQLRAQIEQRGGAPYGLRLHIESISISFIHRITLKNVEVWDTRQTPEVLILQAKQVTLTASLIDLPRALYHRNPMELIGLITVDTPFVVLSPDQLRHRAAGKSRAQTTPLWFALEWDDGTFQWKDPAVPRGVVTLRQSKGFFRVRGPHIDALMRGVIEQAHSIDLHIRTLGHRWSAQARLFDGDIAGTAELLRQINGFPQWPAEWKTRGHFDLEVDAGGRWPIPAGQKPLSLIRNAELTLSNAQLDIPNLPALSGNGAWVFNGSRLEPSNLVIKADSNAFKITGHALPFARTPEVHLTAECSRLELAALSRYLVSTTSSTPFLRGEGTVTIGVKGAAAHPDLEIQAKVPKGDVGRWPFENAVLQIQRRDNRWDIGPSTLHLWQGTFTLKGTSSPELTDLQLTGADLSLQSASLGESAESLKGRLNFSLNTRGAAEALRTTGSLWINDLSWAKEKPESLRGDLEITPVHFEIHSASEDDRIRLQIEGTRTPKSITLQSALLQLRETTTLSVHGTYNLANRRTHLGVEAKNISLDEDVPLPSEQIHNLTGHINVEGTLDGAFPQLLFKADMNSPDLKFGTAPASAVAGTVRWSPDALGVDGFHTDSGLSGSWHTTLSSPPRWDLKLSLSKTPATSLAALLGNEKGVHGDLSGTVSLSHAQSYEGSGNLTLTDGAWGELALPQGTLGFTLHDRSLDIDRVSITSSRGKIDLKGRASWERPPAGQPLARVLFHGEGRAASLNDGALWSASYHLKGETLPSDHWKGSLQLQAPTVTVHRKDSEPFEARVHWDPAGFVWDLLSWGHHLVSQGSIRTPSGEPVVSGQLHAQDLDVAHWHALFSSQTKDPLRGLFNGDLSINGPVADPLVQFKGKIKNGIWRAFRFQSSITGTWKKTGLDPVTLDGQLETGGQFHFQGRVSMADQTASGSLDLNRIELQPIGESLAFPHGLENKASGTLTVSGPLNELRFAGHIEGGPLAFGTETSSPLKLESYVMDLKLEPSPDASNSTRLTVTQALMKTQEEEIRLSPGSFVDFSGLTEARLQIGTEIRNLHLGVFTLFGGLDINGTWQVRPQGFAIQGDFFTRSLYINDYELEQGHVQASYYNRVLSFQPLKGSPSLITGTVDFQNEPQLTFNDFAVTGRGHESLHLSGTVGPQKWDFVMQGAGLDISTLGGLAGFPYSLNGSANVKIKGTGDLAHPNVEGTLDVQDGRVLGLTFQNGSAAFAWQGQRMTFTRLQLSDPGRYTLSGTGVFPLRTTLQSRTNVDNSIDFSLHLTDSNLSLLQSITSEVKSAKGAVQALVQIKGTSDAPVWHGSVRVKNGNVDGAHYVKHLRDFQLAADFDGNDLIISDFRGKSGKGEFTGGGHILFTGFKPKFYDLHLDVPGKPIDVTIPELAIPESPLAKKLHFLTQASQGDAKGRVTFRGPAEEPVFFGEAYISNGHFTFPPSTKNPPPAAFMEWVRRIIWDANLHFADDAWFENELVEANLAGNLAIKGTSDKLRVDGGMDIAQGKFSYLGIEFDIRQARFDIRSTDTGNGIVTTPYVRGIGESKVQTVDPLSGQGTDDTITLTLNYAPVSEIKPQLRSSRDPTLTQEKVLTRVTQLEVENLNPQERNFLYQQQMVRLLDTSLATPLARSLLKRTGLVDELHVSRVINPGSTSPINDPNNPAATQQNTTAVDLLAGTKYTVAKNLSSRLSLGYGLRFEQIQNTDLTNKLDLRSDVEMSYRVLSNVFLKGSFDLPSQTTGSLPDRKVTIEPHWRFGWWGNTNTPRPKPSNSGTPPPATPPGTNPSPGASH